MQVDVSGTNSNLQLSETATEKETVKDQQNKSVYSVTCKMPKHPAATVKLGLVCNLCSSLFTSQEAYLHHRDWHKMPDHKGALDFPTSFPNSSEATDEEELKFSAMEKSPQKSGWLKKWKVSIWDKESEHNTEVSMTNVLRISYMASGRKTLMGVSREYWQCTKCQILFICPRHVIWHYESEHPRIHVEELLKSSDLTDTDVHFFCFYCFRTDFKDFQNLQEHINDLHNSGKKPFPCPIFNCHQVFNNYHKFALHSNKSHTGKYKLKVQEDAVEKTEDEVLPSPEALGSDVPLHQPVEFGNDSALLQSSEDNTNECNMSCEPTVRKESVAIIKLCKLCGKSFSNECEWIEHRRSHEIVVTCPTCNIKISLERLKEHQKSCSFGYLLSCEACGEPFKMTRYHGLHQKMCPAMLHKEGVEIANYWDMTEIQMGRWKCGVCKKTYKKRKALKNHIQHYHWKLFQKCQFCHVYLRNEDVLSRHMKNNDHGQLCVTSKRKRFRLKSGLEPGDKVSYDKIPYQCHVCFRTIMGQSNFIRHKYMHKSDAERFRFHCKFCVKKFTTNYNCRLHMQLCPKLPEGVDLGSPPQFSCHHCDKVYRYKSSLKHHKQRVHAEISSHEISEDGG